MLFTDSNIITAADLSRIDAEVSDVAEANGIDIELVIAQAWSECGDRILDNQQSYGTAYVGLGSSLAHDMAVSNIGWGSNSYPNIRLNQIVTSSSYDGRISTLKNYLVYGCLALFYQNASNRKESDRYSKKFDSFTAEAAKRWSSLFTQGLSVVGSPLESPGALHGVNSGTWDETNVTGDDIPDPPVTVPDPILPGGVTINGEAVTY